LKLLKDGSGGYAGLGYLPGVRIAAKYDPTFDQAQERLRPESRQANMNKASETPARLMMIQKA
jgi:hypothetical protein